MVVVGGGSMLSLLFLDQAMGVPPGEASTKSREILEGSKAGLLSRIPAHPRMDPRLWKVRSIFLCLHTLNTHHSQSDLMSRMPMALLLWAVLCPFEVGVALNVFSPRRKTTIPSYLEMVVSRKSDCLLYLCFLLHLFSFLLTF